MIHLISTDTLAEYFT